MQARGVNPKTHTKTNTKTKTEKFKEERVNVYRFKYPVLLNVLYSRVFQNVQKNHFAS